MKWAVRQRLEFIDRILAEKGVFNRSDLCREFGISVPQASNDIKQYRALCPRNFGYNTSKKRYEATRVFVRFFTSRGTLFEDMATLIKDCDKYLDYNNLTSIGHRSILHQRMKEISEKLNFVVTR